jgi:hypothetical protein
MKRAMLLGWLFVAGSVFAAGAAQSPPGSPPPVASPASWPVASPASSDIPGEASPSPDATHLINPATTLAWTAVAIGMSAPSRREDHTLTADETATTAWLFGGRDGNRIKGDLWRLDLATGTWSRLEASTRAPSARFGHAAVWVNGVGLVIFGGQSRDGFHDDLWAYNPETAEWRRLPSSGQVPAARYGTCSTVGPDGRLWISHGFTSDGRFDDTRAYDFETGRWANMSARGERPAIRCLHDCVWSSDGRLILYGGQTNGRPALGDLWAFGPADRTWTRLPAPEPPGRQLYALATSGSTAWILGGAGADGQKLGDLWALDLHELAFSPVATILDSAVAPAPRSGASLIVDSAGGRLLLFGGETDDRRVADLWALAPSP